ncbi:hypothetical protein ACIBL6_22235 [Streptomyces sp. NPDC050400]|uniref:hypothetical protein n=1 Tax=Streptomyces sp. NPDC050400 TaxID=3365610 RepID=UPI0037A2D111
MVSASRTARSAGSARTIESTAEGLQGDLDRLELQKRALERELAAVAAHLDTVRRAVHALESVMTGPADSVGSEGSEDAEDAANPAPAAKPAAPRPPKRATKSGKRAPRSRNTSRAKSNTDTATATDTDRPYGRLTEQILAYLAQAGDTDVRARDVAAALGRATDSGSINAIRSTLDRLVGASRVQRTGRGLYRAQRS